MKKQLIFLTMLALTGLSQNVDAQTKIFVVNGSKISVINSNYLIPAIQQATAGDTIYLPGGTVQTGGTVYIDKKLTIIGAGWDSDSSASPTVLKSGNLLTNVTFQKGSDGSLLHGCEVANIRFGQYGNPGSQNIQNVTLSRNKVQFDIELGIYGDDNANNASKNIVILQNFAVRIIGCNAEACVISNNFVQYSGGSGMGEVTGFRHSIITNNILNSVQELSFCEVNNNYFVSPYFQKVANCAFNNNAFPYNYTIPGASTSANNLMNQNITSTFITDKYSLTHPKECQLRNDSPCKNAGTDGTDIGLYGGIFPFTSQTFNPRVDKMAVANSTNEEGDLLINIQVSGQKK